MDQTWLKLQNGSDVRSVALEGVKDEPVTLTAEIVRPIGFAFAQWLAAKKGVSAAKLKVAVGHDSRLSSEMVKTAVFQGLEKSEKLFPRVGKIRASAGAVALPSEDLFAAADSALRATKPAR